MNRQTGTEARTIKVDIQEHCASGEAMSGIGKTVIAIAKGALGWALIAAFGLFFLLCLLFVVFAILFVALLLI